VPITVVGCGPVRPDGGFRPLAAAGSDDRCICRPDRV